MEKRGPSVQGKETGNGFMEAQNSDPGSGHTLQRADYAVATPTSARAGKLFGSSCGELFGSSCGELFGSSRGELFGSNAEGHRRHQGGYRDVTEGRDRNQAASKTEQHDGAGVRAPDSMMPRTNSTAKHERGHMTNRTAKHERGHTRSLLLLVFSVALVLLVVVVIVAVVAVVVAVVVVSVA